MKTKTLARAPSTITPSLHIRGAKKNLIATHPSSKFAASDTKHDTSLFLIATPNANLLRSQFGPTGAEETHATPAGSLALTNHHSQITTHGFSNRHKKILEMPPTHSKQTTAVLPNRHKIRPCFSASPHGQNSSHQPSMGSALEWLPKMTSAQTTERDPVCGMTVDLQRAKASVEHAGKTYYFCSPGCAEKFRAAAEKYLAPKPPAPPQPPHEPTQLAAKAPGANSHAPSAAVEYTCPMHPEIIRPAPGACPICGMALEPRTASAEEAENPELASMTTRFWASVALTLPVLILGMSDLIPGQPIQQFLSMRQIGWLEFALATPVVLWGGWPFFERGWASVVNRSLNMFTLIALGTGTAFLYSVVAVLFPQLFPAAFRGMGGGLPVYFEAAAAITTLVLLGQVLELRARSRTSAAIRSLLQLSPKNARLVRTDGTELDVPLEHIQVGDLLRVR